MKPDTSDLAPSATAPNMVRRQPFRQPDRWYQRLKDRLWGYDFFISYHWASGGTYAVNLAAQLREKGYEVFLDREEYAMGDAWQRVGEVALRNTQRLVLIATREAVFESKPVEHEIVRFTDRSRHCIPIFFGDTFFADEEANRGKYIVLDRLADDLLYIVDSRESLAIGPVAEVVEKLCATYSIMRRRKLRQTITLVALSLLASFSIIASLSAINAIIARNKEAVARGQSEKLVADISLQNGHRAINTDGDVGAGLLWYAQSLKPKSEHAKSAQNSARSLIGGWSPSLPRFSMLHDGPILTVVFNRAGTLIATGGADKTVQLWDARTGKPSGNPIAHRSQVQAIAFSPDGKTLATGDGDIAKLWAVATHAPLSEFSFPSTGRYPIQAISFSLDSQKLACGYGGDWSGFVNVWDVATSKPYFPESLHHGDEISSVMYSPDGKILVTAGVDGVKLWDALNGQEIDGQLSQQIPTLVIPIPPEPLDANSTVLDTAETLPAETPQNRTEQVGSTDAPSLEPDAETLAGQRKVSAVAFSPDGRTLATASFKGAVDLWDVDSRLQRCTRLQHDDAVNAVTFSFDGGALAAACRDGTISVWNVAAEPPRLEMKVRNNRVVNAVAFSPIHRELVAASDDRTARLLRIPDPTADPVSHHDANGHAMAMGFSPEGGTLATAVRYQKGDGARLWERTTGMSGGRSVKLKRQFLGETFAPDGRTLALSEGTTVWLWDVATDKQQGAPLAHDSPPNKVSFSPNGKVVAITCNDHSVWIWNTLTGKRLCNPLKHGDWVDELMFSPDGKKLATGSRDRVVWLCDLELGKSYQIPLTSGGELKNIGFSSQNRDFITVEGTWSPKEGRYTSNTVARWAITSGAPVLKLSTHPVGNPVLLSPDGRNLVTTDFGTLRIWNVFNGQQRGKSLQHPDYTHAVAFSPDSSTLVTICKSFISLWDVPTGAPKSAPIKHTDQDPRAVFSHDGKLLAITNGGQVRFWDVSTGQLRGEPCQFATMITQPQKIAFSPDDRTLAIANGELLQFCDVPRPVTDDPEQVQLSAEVRTGQSIDNGLVQTLTRAEWSDRRKKLQAIGGDCLNPIPALVVKAHSDEIPSALSSTDFRDSSATNSSSAARLDHSRPRSRHSDGSWFLGMAAAIACLVALIVLTTQRR